MAQLSSGTPSNPLKSITCFPTKRADKLILAYVHETKRLACSTIKVE